MEPLLSILPISQHFLWVVVTVFFRLGAMMALMPAFGDQPVPMRMRLLLTLMFTSIVAPAVAQTDIVVPDDYLSLVSQLGWEMLIGLFFGFFVRFFILMLQIAGSIAAQSTSLSQIFGGSAGADPQPAIGHLLVVAGLALAVLLGLHVQVAIYMIDSYAILPAGSRMSGDIVSQIGVAEVTRTFGTGFTLAAPFLIASLVYNVVLGFINKAMPQLMVSFVGAPAITAGGLLLLFLSAPFLLGVWINSLHHFLQSPFSAWP